MATLADVPDPAPARDERWFLSWAIVMSLLAVAGFSFQLAMGRSSFSAPLLVHAHAVVFMGWLALYLLQNFFVTTDRITMHRRLGWIGAGWMAAMVVLGCAVTLAMVRRGQVPFFFQPQHFLIFDPMIMFAFAGLTIAAIMQRRRTDWHRRLHFCGLALLVGPGIARLLPNPLLQPFAFETFFATSMIFPIVGALTDIRRGNPVHPAWRWGMGAMIGMLLLTEAITHSPVGDAIYQAMTAGHPGAAVPPMAFAPPPGAP
jgi:hypothetical protein